MATEEEIIKALKKMIEGASGKSLRPDSDAAKVEREDFTSDEAYAKRKLELLEQEIADRRKLAEEIGVIRG